MRRALNICAILALVAQSLISCPTTHADDTNCEPIAPGKNPIVSLIDNCQTALKTWNPESGRWEAGCHIGAPINPATGEVYWLHRPDFTLRNEGSTLSLWRTYRSHAQAPGLLGAGWRYNFEMRITAGSGTFLTFTDETGKEIVFHSHATQPNTYKSETFPGAKIIAIKTSGATTWQLETPETQTYLFDAAGRLGETRFRSGQRLIYRYADGRLRAIEDSFGKKVRLRYETTHGLLTALEEASTGMPLVSLSYDQNQRLERATDADGNFETYEYAPSTPWLTRAVDGEGALLEAHRYDRDGQGTYSKSTEGEFEITYLAPAGKIHPVKVTRLDTKDEAVFRYDEAGRQVSRVGDIGVPSSEQNSFDAAGRIVAQRNAGLVSRLQYDEDRPTELAQKSGGDSRTIRLEYHHPKKLPTLIAEPSVVKPGAEKIQTFEYEGDLLSRETERGYTWDLLGRIRPYQARTTYTYNHHGQLTTKTDPRGTLRYAYYPVDAPGFAAGRVQEIRTPDGETVAYADYDFHGSPRTITYNDNLRETLTTLPSGKVAIDADGRHYSYDRGSKLREVETESGARKRYTYDSLGKLIAVHARDARGEPEQMLHDETQSPEPTTESAIEKTFPHTVDARGNLLSVGATHFAYDLNNRLVEARWPNGATTIARYDDRGQLAAEGPSFRQLTRHEYDLAGRRTATRYPSGQTRRLAYDSEGHLTHDGDRELTYPARFTRPSELRNSGSRLQIAYDGLGQSTRQTLADLASARAFTLDYERDASGGLVSLTYPDGYRIYYRGGMILGSDGKTILRETTPGESYQLGPISVARSTDNGRLLAYRVGDLFDLRYEWNARGLPTKISDRKNAVRAEFTYNTQGFLIAEKGTSTDWRGEYDALGNWTLPPARGTRELDADGRLVGAGKNRYFYDVSGKLTRAETPRGTAEYRYDPLGRRIAKTFAHVTTYFAYDENGRLVYEATPAREEKIRYIYRGAEIIAFQAIQRGVTHDYYVVNDHRLAPMAVLNNEGRMVARADETTPYSIRLKNIGYARVPYRFGFLGQYYDEESGLYYNETRYYEPSTGRYLTPDPTGIFGGANPYTYARSNPVAYVDPHGTRAETAADAQACHLPSPSTAAVIDPHSVPDDGSVYAVGNQRWDMQHEKDYAKWVHDNIDADFMERFQLKTDCAKAATTIRAIFSRIDDLPALFTNGRKTVGHFSKDWANLGTIADWSGDHWKTALNQDKRFRAYVYAAMAVVSTGTIPLNTYPVQLTDAHDPRKLSPYVHEGTPLVDATHVRFITQINPGTFMPVQELASDLPVEIRQLNAGPFSLFDYPRSFGRGVVGWRWAVHCGGSWKQIPAEEMPGYSTQQYELPTEPSLAAAEAKLVALHADQKIQTAARLELEPNKEHFTPDEKWHYDTAVAKFAEDEHQESLTERTIALYRKDPSLKYEGAFPSYIHTLAGDRAPSDSDIKANVDVLLAKIKDRVKLVNDAQQKLAEDPKIFSDPSAAAYDDYSTPERDKQAFLLWSTLSRTMAAFDREGTSFSEKFKEEMRSRTVDLGNGTQINLELFFEAIPAGAISSDPGATFERRWGLSYIAQQIGPALAEESGRLEKAKAARKTAAEELAHQQALNAAEEDEIDKLEATLRSDDADIQGLQSRIGFLTAQKELLPR